MKQGAAEECACMINEGSVKGSGIMSVGEIGRLPHQKKRL